MRAAVYHGPGDLRVEERDKPTIADDEALLRVVGCGVCGTDHRIVSGGHRAYPPGTERVPGHELVGEIVEAGPDVKGALPTSGLVFVAPNIGCGHCRQCLSGNNNHCAEFQAIGVTLDGGFADYVRIPGRAIAQGNVIPLGADVDPLIATLIEPLACVLRGQGALDIGPGATVLVVGAGPIGILHAMLARLTGAGLVMISDRVPSRLETAKRQGADIAVDVGDDDLAAIVSRATGGRGADVVIVAAPAAEAMVAALDQAALGGRIAFFAGLSKQKSALTLDANLIHYKELRVSGTTGCSTLDCHRSADIVNSGRLDLAPLVTRRLALDALPGEFSPDAAQSTVKTVMAA